MRISLIIPAYNEEKLLGRALAEVRRSMGVFDRAGWESELIVCDNNSTDRTAQLAREAGAQVVFEPVRQIGRARNTGAAAASGDWLLFMDADSQPNPGLYEDVVEQIRSGRCLAGGSTVKLDENHRLAVRILEFWNWVSRTFRLMAGSFIFCETAAFREVGGFNQELYASEELDLSKRLKVLARRSGKQIVILERNPLITSARKFHLYTPTEYFWFLSRTVLSAGRTLKRRESCQPWYDGRR